MAICWGVVSPPAPEETNAPFGAPVVPSKRRMDCAAACETSRSRMAWAKSAQTIISSKANEPATAGVVLGRVFMGREVMEVREANWK